MTNPKSWFDTNGLWGYMKVMIYETSVESQDEIDWFFIQQDPLLDSGFIGVANFKIVIFCSRLFD